jgi:hypothetical protein
MARENAERLPNVSLLEGGEEAVREDVIEGLIPRVFSSRLEGVVQQGYKY